MFFKTYTGCYKENKQITNSKYNIYKNEVIGRFIKKVWSNFCKVLKEWFKFDSLNGNLLLRTLRVVQELSESIKLKIKIIKYVQWLEYHN